jgi:flagellar biosynthesis/type III secretory pathway chaperone
LTSADPLADLLAVLEAQKTVYGHLLRIAEERHAALGAADTDQLNALAEAEQPLVSRVRRLESARLQLVRPWAEQLDIAPEEVTVTRIAEVVPPAAAAQLTAARDQLLAAVQQVDDANQRNAHLLNACLESVNESVQHLLHTVQLDPRYAQSGSRASQPGGPRLTDYRA